MASLGLNKVRVRWLLSMWLLVGWAGSCLQRGLAGLRSGTEIHLHEICPYWLTLGSSMDLILLKYLFNL